MARSIAGEQAIVRVIHFASFEASLIPDLIALESAATAYPWTVSMLEASLTAKADCQKICKSSETIGYRVVQRVLDEAEILNIVIFRCFQARGYGCAAIRKLQAELTADGVQKLFLEVRESNLAARALYVKTGFDQVGIRQGYYRAVSQGESAQDAWVMACKLDVD